MIPRIASSVASNADRGNPLPLLVPYRGLMIGIIDWSAYGVFTIADSKEQLSDGDWTAAGMAAVNIIAASTLLTLPGSGREDAIRLAEPEWRDMVEAMQNASVSVALAVQGQDKPRLAATAGLLADSCNTCHERFRELPYERSRDFARLR
ncbi:MAG: hypothetical protein ABMA14_21195 [Hyphomonadaceae bacterium]